MVGCYVGRKEISLTRPKREKTKRTHTHIRAHLQAGKEAQQKKK